MDFEIRPATPSDHPQMLATLREYHGGDPQRRFDWLYRDNPHGKGLTWVAIAPGGELAGMTSFFLRRMVVDGRPALGALGGDGFVRPAFRRRGLGRRLHLASRADMPKHGIEVMFGTPMPANLTPLTQVGARSIAETVRYVRPLGARALKLPLADVADRIARPLLRLTVPGGARLIPLSEDDREVDRLWAQMAPEVGIATVRDSAFYVWRFLRSPSQQQHPFLVEHRGEIIGAIALERAERSLRIVDLVAPQRSLSHLLGAAALAADHEDVVELKLTQQRGNRVRMWRHGYLPRGNKPLNLLLPPGDPNAAVLFDPERWHFTWADTDMDHG